MIGNGAGVSSSAVPIILPQSRFNHKFERNTVDSEPILWGKQSNQESSDKPVCGVCQINQSRYSCPRSQTPYCSVECYQQLPSTEGFYENRVQSVLQLESKEHKEDTLRMLNRQYQKQREEGGSLGPEEEEDDDDVDMEELKELLSILMTMNDEQDQNENESAKQSLDKLLCSMSPSLRAAFERDLQNGTLQKLVLQEWYPWWRREFGGGREESNNSIAVDRMKSTKTLDERLLEVPNFSQLSKKFNPQLQFHVLEIVYSYCWTMRLYHGLENIVRTTPHATNAKDSPATEAVASFFSHSQVLHQQTKHQYSTMEEVLIQCTAASTKASQNDGCNADWNVLVQDCSLIFSSRRFVGRALIEAMDIIQVALQDYKKQRKQCKEGANEAPKGSGKVAGPQQTDEIERQIQTLRKVRKKLEFLTSWSKQAAELDDQEGDSSAISREIEEWRRHWQISSCGDEELNELHLPNTNTGAKTSASPPVKNESAIASSSAGPWMSVVGTRSK